MEKFVDELLVTTLQFWIRKIRRGDCTHEQEKAILNAIESSGDVYGTIDEIAEFFGKTRDAVSSVIKRGYVGSPKRNIAMYSFLRFMRAKPKNWHPKDSESES